MPKHLSPHALQLLGRLVELMHGKIKGTDEEIAHVMNRINTTLNRS